MGLSPSDLEQTPLAVETLAYTRYVLDAGMRGDLLALKLALATCVWVRGDRNATRLVNRCGRCDELISSLDPRSRA
ncbi:hypothetical protein [Bradyrhizobium yuanmingense]|uniref:hypothetical protein n=1 Tax=Bradyrhizobium yuanmingense TaxID=108015 RepID=UPI003B977412